MSAKTSTVTQRLNITKKTHKTKPKQTHSDDMFSCNIILGSRGGKKPQLKPKTNQQTEKKHYPGQFYLKPFLVLRVFYEVLTGLPHSMEDSQAIHLSIGSCE